MARNVTSRSLRKSQESNAALRLAAGEGNLAAVKALLAAGADIHANDDAALLRAALAGHDQTVRLLMRRGATPGAWADVALLMAEHNGHAETARLLAADMALVRIKGRPRL